MRIDLQLSASVSGGGWGINEDIVSVRSNSAWVLDGATGLGEVNYTPDNTDGKWYVTHFNTYLNKTIDKKEMSLSEIVKEGIKRISREFRSHSHGQDIDSAHVPSAACAICRLSGDKLEVFVLGDCSLLISHEDSQLERIYDGRIDDFDAEVGNRIRELVKKNGLSIYEAREECLTLLRKNRRKKNTADGYWTLGMDPAAASEALTEEFMINESDIVYGMTDGYSALVDTYDRFRNWRQAIAFLEGTNLQTGLERIRQAESTDPECIKYPRTKPQDDATAFRVSFEQTRKTL